MILLFKVTKSHQKAMSKVQAIVCGSKYYQNDFRYEARAPRREALASDSSALQFSSMKSLKMFTTCEICPADHLKVGKKGVTKAVSSLFAILCYLSLSQIWSYELFLSTGTRKGTNMFNSPTNLRKFHLRKCHKSGLKDPYFLCRKTLRNGIELR